ncbi:hypothetical protein SLEP1_g21429 [Rubroshorea leprosula]|uniref:Early nodulin-93-like n=1 Tax=Rubroshorea leprosula TaxID=152421 RepID=A0AAV5J922_9ROSI|nr:hypothetical protein SLEP1_g21429 [Rubroshorea leprosula]
MGILSATGGSSVERARNSVVIASPNEEAKRLRAEKSSQEGIRAGFKAAAIGAVASAVPTLIAVRKIPWAKANLNYTAQALIISGASIASFFITVDKAILTSARKQSQAEYEKRA